MAGPDTRLLLHTRKNEAALQAVAETARAAGAQVKIALGDLTDPDLPPLAFGAPEEPVLYPEAEDADLDSTLAPAQVRWLLGAVSQRTVEAAERALHRFAEGTAEQAPATDG